LRRVWFLHSAPPPVFDKRPRAVAKPCLSKHTLFPRSFSARGHVFLPRNATRH